MREALKSRIDPQTGNASMPKPQTVEPIVTPQPLTGSALRQERLQKVAEGRAESVKTWEEVSERDKSRDDGMWDEINAKILNDEKTKQQKSAEKAVVFSENRNQDSGVPTSQQFDVTQVNFAAITRAAKLKRAAQAAQSEMAQNTKGTPPENQGVAISGPTPKPPITPGVSATKDPATV